MSPASNAIAPEMALRIGLAARALEIEPARMLAVLDDTIGLPPTEASFAKLSVKALRTANSGDLFGVSQDALKKAIAILKGADEVMETVPLPDIQPYEDGDMVDSIRIAIASNTGTALDGHFGSCKKFAIFQVSKEEARLIDVRTTAFPVEEAEPEDKNKFRAGLIEDCQVVYVVSIGGPAAAKVVRASIHPVKKPQGASAEDIIDEMKSVLSKAPPPWLAKVMGHDAEDRIRFDQDEDDDFEGVDVA